MSINNIYSQLVIVAGVIAILIIASNPSAFAKTVQVNGSGQGTDLTTAFKFHEGAPANSAVSTGKDNIRGTFNECRLSKNILLPQTVAPRPMEPRAPHLLSCRRHRMKSVVRPTYLNPPGTLL